MLEIIANEDSLLSVKHLFSAGNEYKVSDNPVIEETVRQLDEFFEEKRESFELPLKILGTRFQQRVWDVVSKIPLGKTLSYREVAYKLGDVNKVRAVGAANGKNSFQIIIPCHRVVGANGELIGYAGGLDSKKWLLNFEQKITTRQLQMF